MITLNAITKSYKVGENIVNVLNNTSLSIEKGEMVAIMGPSGSGKTTLLNILGGMDCADSGEYFYDSMAVHNLKKYQLHQFRKETVGFVFQQFALMNQYTVYENVELPLCIKNISRKERKRRVMEVLEEMHLMDMRGKLPTKLSGGQQQRCAIGRALISNNALILADEPTGALDQATGNEIMDIIERINEEGKTVIVVTHDVNIAKRAKRIIYMEDGCILHQEEK